VVPARHLHPEGVVLEEELHVAAASGVRRLDVDHHDVVLLGERQRTREAVLEVIPRGLRGRIWLVLVSFVHHASVPHLPTYERPVTVPRVVVTPIGDDLLVAQPARQVCPLCGFDDDVEVLFAADEWIFSCVNRGHPRYEWRPVVAAADVTYRSGVGEEWGVYDTLLGCLGDGWSEYGVLEHRFAERSREAYDFLVRRYGHTALAQTKYSASAFLGGALGQLFREGAIRGRWGKATGYWRYNGQIGTYAPLATADEASVLLWEDFATDTLAVSPLDWPALGYVHPATS
jgi:hypothetical protein